MPRCASHMIITGNGESHYDYSPSMASAMNARNLLEYWSGSAVLIPSTLDPYLTVLAALAVIFLTPGKNKSSWSLRDRHFCSPSGSQKLIVVLISLKRTLTCIEQRWGLLSEPKNWPQHWGLPHNWLSQQNTVQFTDGQTQRSLWITWQ